MILQSTYVVKQKSEPSHESTLLPWLRWHKRFVKRNRHVHDSLAFTPCSVLLPKLVMNPPCAILIHLGLTSNLTPEAWLMSNYLVKWEEQAEALDRGGSNWSLRRQSGQKLQQTEVIEFHRVVELN